MVCWLNYRNNHHRLRHHVDLRCCFVYRHRRYRRRWFRRYHRYRHRRRRRRLHRQQQLLSSRNYRLEIETCPSDELVSISSREWLPNKFNSGSICILIGTSLYGEEIVFYYYKLYCIINIYIYIYILSNMKMIRVFLKDILKKYCW